MKTTYLNVRRITQILKKFNRDYAWLLTKIAEIDQSEGYELYLKEDGLMWEPPSGFYESQDTRLAVLKYRKVNILRRRLANKLTCPTVIKELLALCGRRVEKKKLKVEVEPQAMETELNLV